MKIAVVFNFFIFICFLGAIFLFFGCENHWIIGLTDHMYRDPAVSRISASYQSTKTIYELTPLDSLKEDITVTAFFVDGTKRTLNAEDYTLTGTLTVGTSVITVSYDGKTSTFTVTVTVPPADAKEILEFSFPSLSVTGTIDEGTKAISVTVPYGTVVTSLTPTVTHIGASYIPQGAQDFTSIVVYTVTAADGSSQNYTVAVTTAEPPGSSPENPIIINSGNALEVLHSYIHNNLDKHYQLEADVVLPAPPPGQSNWTPIGSNNPRFTGSFDGGGHTITGLTIDGTGNLYGMFGVIGTDGEVKNLGLVDVNISGNNHVGGLVGYNYGTVQNTYATGSVSGGNVATGGLVGINVGTVENSYAAVNVNGGSTQTGGLVGLNNDGGIVQNSYATGSVSGNGASGLVGVSNGSTVQNSVALNPVIVKTEGTSNSYGRVTWRMGGTGANNYGRLDMILPSGITVTSNATGTHGADVSATTNEGNAIGGYHDISFWRSVFTDFDIHWEWNNTTNLPILRNVGGAQDHRVNFVQAGITYTLNADGEYTITGGQPDEDGLLVIPSSINSVLITAINEEAFRGNTNITEVVIEDGVQTIGNLAFYGCTSLEKVTIPGSVTTIGNSSFSTCRELTEVIISEGVQIIGNSAFYYCSLESIIIPNTVTSIGSQAFSYCRFTEITIPDSVTLIGSNAFSACSLETVTIGIGVTTIGNNAFTACLRLKTVIMKPIIPPTLGTRVFMQSLTSEVPIDLEKINVPSGSVDAYKDAPNWNEWASIIEESP